jgi:galactokinase
LKGNVLPQMTELLWQFERLTGREPEGVWSAPGRVNLIGEHTDYNQGYVLPIAIDRWISVTAARSDDRCIKCVSMQENERIEYEIGALEPGTVEGWAGYPCGAAWALKSSGIDVKGTDLVVDSTIPAGAGLASSAALTTAVASCLSELSGSPLSGSQLALASHRAEAEFVGVPCGVMDQMISALGRSGQALFLDTQTSEYEHVPFDLAGAGLTLAVIDTRVPHHLVESGYAERRRECEEAAGSLGARSLRELTLEGLPVALDSLSELHGRRVRHVVTENARVLEVVQAIVRREFELVGEAFVRSHESLRTDFEVSCPELNTAVGAAIEAGALGARMTGAGFGGSAIALMERSLLRTVSERIPAAFQQRGFTAPVIFEVVASGGASRL